LTALDPHGVIRRVTHLRSAVAALLLTLPIPLTGTEPPAAPAVHVPFVEGRPFAEILARAQREKKPILLDVYATWCNPCKWMDRTTFSDPGVVSWVNGHVVPARVDAEKGEGRRIAARYAVTSFPTTIFLEPGGAEIDRLLGAHPADAFEKYADQILAGKGPLASALADLKRHFSMDAAMQLVTALGERGDLVRVRPIAIRVLEEDPDLTDSRTLGALAVVATMEDGAGKVSPEVSDLIETYLPKIGADPRRGTLAVVLARELGRRGDAAGLRAHVEKIAPTLSRDGFLSDLYAVLGSGERSARALEASEAALRKSLAILEEQRSGTASIVVRRLELCETLVETKKYAEVRAFITKVLEAMPGDPGVLARVAILQIRMGEKQEALRNARQAVETTKGNEAYPQAALAKVLAATGDQKGAKAAWERAHAIEPDNPEYGKPLAKPATP
jgi:thioredoxin-like negative regulator of GroEL